MSRNERYTRFRNTGNNWVYPVGVSWGDSNTLQADLLLMIAIKNKVGKSGLSFCWALVMAWLGANFLSQIAYIINYGTPYDGTAMLLQLGGWYWMVVLVEVLFWIMFGSLILQKVRSRGDQQPTASLA